MKILPALVSLGVAFNGEQKKDIVNGITYEALGMKAIDDRTVDCVVDINDSVYGLELAAWYFDKGDFDSVANGVIQVGKVISGIGQSMLDCEDKSSDATHLKEEGQILIENARTQIVDQKLVFHGQDLSEEIDSFVHSYRAQNYLGAGEAVGDLAQKLFHANAMGQFAVGTEFKAAAGADATCPCDHAFEYFVAFTNQIILEIDTRNLLDSLRTKSLKFFAAADPAFKNVTTKDTPEQDAANMATFSAAIYESYHEMTADAAFVPEATTVRPYLLCITNMDEAPNKKARGFFQMAAEKYNGGHWHDAGMYMGMAVMETCPNPPPAPGFA